MLTAMSAEKSAIAPTGGTLPIQRPGLLRRSGRPRKLSTIQVHNSVEKPPPPWFARATIGQGCFAAKTSICAAA